MPAKINPIGQRFGRLLVIEEASKRFTKQGKPQIYWRCLCDCGAETEVRVGSLRQKKRPTRSCGCLSIDTSRKKGPLQIEHGHASRSRGKTPEYITWQNMKGRCNNPNNPKYFSYGGRGVKICGRWNDYSLFLTDMGPKPGAEYSIDRIDPDKGYEPGNCRWATPATQQRNRTNNRNFTIAGVTKTLTEWCVGAPVSRKAIKYRIDVMGWSLEKALVHPPNKR